MIRLLALFSVALVAACGESTPSESPTSRATRLQAEGNPEAALSALRDAIRSTPQDPELRLTLAEVYLDLDQGALAGTALDQALDRGLVPARAVLPRARSLFAEGRLLDVIELQIPVGLSVGDIAGVKLLKAEARAARSTADEGLDDEVTKDYFELFDLLERNKDNPSLNAMASRLSKARSNRQDIERAWQHHACAQSKVKPVEWQPLDRSSGRVLQVGPERELRTIASAARVAEDGDTVEIDPGTYEGDVALWPQNSLIVRGSGETPLITSNGKVIQDRDIWLFTGDDVVVENVEISGARSRHENGAGIRHIGNGLTLRNVYLHDNENGVLTSNRYPDTNHIVIEFSEFARNGDGRGYAHNIYVGRSKRFEMRYSYSHASRGGHLVKSRARENTIAYNRLTDGEGGTSSYIVNIPEGGLANIISNVIEQGAETLNHGMISYAGEEIRYAENQLVVANNSVYNRDFQGIGVRNHADLDVMLVNNLFGGAPIGTVEGKGQLLGNLTRPEHGMTDPRNYDFSLMSGAGAIDRGIQFAPEPKYEYVHPKRARTRQNVWRIDVGAYESCGL